MRFAYVDPLYKATEIFGWYLIGMCRARDERIKLELIYL